MRIVILGSGAIGGSVGARLVQAGHDVQFVARGPHGAAIRDRGLRVDAPDGSFAIRADVVEHASNARGDVVLLCTKTHQAHAALSDLRIRVPIVCLTNGLEAERIALRLFPEVHGVSVYTPATHLEPGVVLQWSSPLRGIFDIGSYPRGISVLDRELAQLFASGGFASEPRDDIMAYKRTKLISNLSNGIDAMVGDRDLEIAGRARDEARAVYTAAGLTFAPSIEEDPRRKLMPRGQIAGAPKVGGSTWQSVARGARELETDYLNGEIALLGRLHGVPTPANDKLQRLAAAFAREGRPAGSMSPAELE